MQTKIRDTDQFFFQWGRQQRLIINTPNFSHCYTLCPYQFLTTLFTGFSLNIDFN